MDGSSASATRILFDLLWWSSPSRPSPLATRGGSRGRVGPLSSLTKRGGAKKMGAQKNHSLTIKSFAPYDLARRSASIHDCSKIWRFFFLGSRPNKVRGFFGSLKPNFEHRDLLFLVRSLRDSKDSYFQKRRDFCRGGRGTLESNRDQTRPRKVRVDSVRRSSSTTSKLGERGCQAKESRVLAWRDPCTVRSGARGKRLC